VDGPILLRFALRYQRSPSAAALGPPCCRGAGWLAAIQLALLEWELLMRAVQQRGCPGVQWITESAATRHLECARRLLARAHEHLRHLKTWLPVSKLAEYKKQLQVMVQQLQQAASSAPSPGTGAPEEGSAAGFDTSWGAREGSLGRQVAHPCPGGRSSGSTLICTCFPPPSILKQGTVHPVCRTLPELTPEQFQVPKVTTLCSWCKGHGKWRGC